MPDPCLLHPEPLPLWQAPADLYLPRRHSNTQRQVWLLLPDLHTDFSRGRSCGLVFPSLSEFSIVCGDPQKGFGVVNEAEIDVFLNSIAFLIIQQMLAI